MQLRRWTSKPNSKITMLENLSIGLAYIQKDMTIKLVGIGAEGLHACMRASISSCEARLLMLRIHVGDVGEGVCADVYNGYLKLILGLVWSLFRGLQMRRLAAGGSCELPICCDLM
jgi:hypothetical protein